MRAWRLHRHGEPAEVLQLDETAEPQPGPGEVVIKGEAVALGFPDVLMCRGTYPLLAQLPFPPGQEVCGTVARVGAGVTLQPGTRVMAVVDFVNGHGGLADYSMVPANRVHLVPDWLEAADAASFFIAYFTGWLGLAQRGGLQKGETLAVLGASGGTGIAAVALGKAMGAKVVAVAGGAAKGEYCRKFGADAVVDHQQGALADQIRAATGGRGADVIYDPVGGDTANEAAKAMANEGRFLMVGGASGAWPKLHALDILMRNYTVMGVYAGAYDRPFVNAAVAKLLAMRKAGELPGLVTQRTPFAEAPKAVQGLADRAVLGRSVVLHG